MASFGKKATAPAGTSFGNRRAPPQRRFSDTAKPPATSDLSAEAMAFLNTERSRSGYEFQAGGGNTASKTNLSGGKPVSGRRILSYLIDSLIVMVPFCLIMWPSISTAFMAVVSAEPESVAAAKANLKLFELLILMAAVRCAYAVAMEASPLQATVGKMTLGIVVTNKDGQKPSLGTVLMRNTIGRFVLNVIPFYIGYGLLLFNKEKKGLHDMLSGSMVCTKAPYSQSSVSEVFA